MSFDLERALEDLAEAGAARRTTDDDVLTQRVSLMTTRIRRRRALRHVGTTAVAACAVGALAVGVTYLPAVLGTAAPTGPAASGGGASAEGLVPVELGAVCGQPVETVSEQVGYWAGSNPPPTAEQAGSTLVTGVEPTAEGFSVDVQYLYPAGASVERVGWTLLLVDGSGTVAAGQAYPVEDVDPAAGAVGTGTLLPMTLTPCAADGRFDGELRVVAVAEAHGTLATGQGFVDRMASTPFVVGGDGGEEVEDLLGGLFACGSPAPSPADLPDGGGLTLEVDVPETWDPSTALTGTVGTRDGASVLANLPTGVSLALADASGTVVGLALPSDPSAVDLVSVGPGTTASLSSAVTLVGCTAEGLAGGEGVALEGSYTAWPFVSGVLKEVVDAQGNAGTPSAEPVVVVADPQEVTITR